MENKYFIVRERYNEMCMRLRQEDDGGKKDNVGWSVEYQAQYLGCTRRAMNMYLAQDNQRHIPLAKLNQLAELLRCSPMWLCGKSDIRSEEDATADTVTAFTETMSTLGTLLKQVGIEFTAYDNNTCKWRVVVDPRSPCEKMKDEENKCTPHITVGTMSVNERAWYEEHILETITLETEKFLKCIQRHRIIIDYEKLETAEKIHTLDTDVRVALDKC